MYIILDLLHSLWKIFLFLSEKSVQFIVHAYKACLTCKLFKIFFYVRIMSRASHKNMCKSDDIWVNENLKLKSEIYKMQKLYVQKKEKR